MKFQIKIHPKNIKENILIHNGIYKIADFGLAQFLRVQSGTDVGVAGTPQTCAPEILLQ
jgi:serine/threonine protein kinase